MRVGFASLVLVCSFALASFVIAEESADPFESKAPAVKTTVLSAADVVKDGKELFYARKPVTVRYRVDSVTPQIIRDEKGNTHEEWKLGSGIKPQVHGAFSVCLSPEVEATFKRIGITDIAKHFAGREIEVRGQVIQVGLNLISRKDTIWTYYIRIDSLDQILAVEEAKAAEE